VKVFRQTPAATTDTQSLIRAERRRVEGRGRRRRGGGVCDRYRCLCVDFETMGVAHETPPSEASAARKLSLAHRDVEP
jgi:hypothetical protein